MDWDKFRELYSRETKVDEWWGDEEDGTWKYLEAVPVGKPQLHPSNQLPQFTKVAAGSEDDDSYGTGGRAWMIVSYGTPDGTEAYIKITGWYDSYGTNIWHAEPERVSRKTRTEVFYE